MQGRRTWLHLWKIFYTLWLIAVKKLGDCGDLDKLRNGKRLQPAAPKGRIKVHLVGSLTAVTIMPRIVSEHI